MANNKEEARKFYQHVMEGNNDFAQGIISKVNEACGNLIGTDPVRVILTNEEGKWLVNNPGGTLRIYVRALTGTREVFEWYGIQSVLHIEDPEHLCEQCGDLSRLV